MVGEALIVKHKSMDKGFPNIFDMDSSVGRHMCTFVCMGATISTAKSEICDLFGRSCRERRHCADRAGGCSEYYSGTTIAVKAIAPIDSHLTLSHLLHNLPYNYLEYSYK